MRFYELSNRGVLTGLSCKTGKMPRVDALVDGRRKLVLPLGPSLRRGLVYPYESDHWLLSQGDIAVTHDGIVLTDQPTHEAITDNRALLFISAFSDPEYGDRLNVGRLLGHKFPKKMHERVFVFGRGAGMQVELDRETGHQLGRIAFNLSWDGVRLRGLDPLPA